MNFLLFEFQFNTHTNALARCPHCRKVSSVGPEFARGRGLIFLLLASLCLLVTIGITAMTMGYAEVCKRSNIINRFVKII